MRLGILGAGPATLAVAQAAAVSGKHVVAWVCELSAPGESQVSDVLRSIIPKARFADHWEALLDTNMVDGVLVSRHSDQDLRAEQLRKFAQAGMPVLVSHPVVDSMLVYYELDMIRRETSCVMLPYLPHRWHPAVVALAKVWNDGCDSPIGAAEQLVVERHLADRSKTSVLTQFARDVDLVRSICGEVARIGAMGPRIDDADYANLGVQMSTSGSFLARWSVAPVETVEGARVQLVGKKDKAVLTMASGSEPWRLEFTGSGAPPVEFADWDPGKAALDRFAEAVSSASAEPGWADAARSVEISEAVGRSLRKGRTVELHLEEFTEEATFKGTMASLGCGLLLAGLLLLMVLAVLEQVEVGQVKLVFPNWPYLLVGVLGLFLVLQLLTLLFRKGEKQPPAD